ncbi:MAG: hypothetical protein NC915_03120 [Candidatus Omnitrophica bacterium]|nr:hypothetical protein [Candidatus Omnitrophota bacterium]
MDKAEKKTIFELLSNFNLKIRKKAFLKVVELIKNGQIKKDNEFKNSLNIHIHTFHSFNYKNWSPLRVVFEGWKKGLLFLGTVDFDTLEGVEETLWAGRLLSFKVVSGFETRVFLREMKDMVINSPNEPGIFYLCGKGFEKIPKENSKAGIYFEKLKMIAQERNKKIIEKINDYLNIIKVDYERDVLPLTPSQNPTERHIVLAYSKKSELILKEKAIDFWSDILGIKKEKIIELKSRNLGQFYEIIRMKLIKIGGPGYIKPESSDFPLFDEVVEIIEKAGGVPVGTYLDGTSEGEKNPEFLIELLKNKKIKGITVIPERNWNIKDENEKKLKLKKFDEFITVCKKMNMPVICGTEMNKYGQPFVDNFSRSEISKYLEYFIKSFKIIFS